MNDIANQVEGMQTPMTPAAEPAPIAEPSATPEPASVEPSVVETVVDNMSPEEHLRFDPFAENPILPAAAKTPEPAAPTAVVPGAAPVLGPEARLALLEAQATTGQSAAVQPAPAQAPATPAAPVTTGDPAVDEVLNKLLDQYNTFNASPALLDALNSPEPEIQAQGVQAIMIGVARAVTNQLYQHITPQFAGMNDQIGSQVSELIQAREIYSDFYGAYPVLNNPAYHSLVQATMKQMQTEAEYKTMQYGPQLRDALGARVATLLNTTPEGLRPINSGSNIPRQPGGALINGKTRPAGINEPVRNAAADMLASVGGDPGMTLQPN